MPQFIEMLGQQSAAQGAGNFINEGMGLMFQGIKNKQQQRQQRALTNIQIDAQKHLTDFNFQKQLEMWKATNYGAQVEQLKAAGLNPGLLYGMSGGGGATTGGGGGTNVTGGAAQTAQASRGAEGLGLQIGQMGLLEAQRKNIEADTKLKEADAINKGADTENKYLTNEFLSKTMEDRIDIINTDRQRQIEELDIAIGNKEVERRTREQRVEEINLRAATALIEQKLAEQLTKESKAKVGNLGKQNELIDSEKELIKQKIKESDELIKYWANIMAQKWAQMDREGAGPADAEPEFFEKLLDKIPGFIIGGKLGRFGGGHTPVKGFRQ